MTAHDWAQRLASGVPIGEPVVVVTAHPDDESLFAGAALARMRDLTLVLLTDGAPADMGDARRSCFATREDYADARADELRHALAVLAPHARLVRYDVPDQAAVTHLSAIVGRLTHDLAGAALVLTHPYEGGHPDHDAAACAVARATLRLESEGQPTPAIAEFACYRTVDGTRMFGRFAADPACPEQVRPLDADDRDRIDRALAAHATQAAVFGRWRPEVERWRAAPAYDFTAPPPGEAILYDGFGWPLTSARWRELAAAC